MAMALGAGVNIVHVIHSGGFYGAERMLMDHCMHVPGRHRVVFLGDSAEVMQRFRQVGIDSLSCAGLGALYKELRMRPGVLNAHNFRAQLFSWLCVQRLRLPLLLTQHGFTPRSRKQRFYTWSGLRLARCPGVARVACVSRGIADLHRAAGVAETKLEVIPNGLPPAGAVARAALTPLLGYVGRLSREKGPDQFLDAVLPLCRQRPALQAVLIGDGEMEAELRERVAAAGVGQQVHFAGYQSDVAVWLARLSVLVISSRTEGTPMVLLEAMRAGTPVAAFAVGGIPDVVTDGEQGLLALPGDSAALTECLVRLLDEPGLADRLAAAARVRQEKDHDLRGLGARWATLYHQLAGQKTC